MFVHNLNPVFLDLGFLQIRYYGIFYIIGFLFSIWWVGRFSKLDKKTVYDLFFWLIIGLIIGARLAMLFIWEPAYYFANPLKLLAVWEGGMSFHGGLIGTLIAGIIFCRKRKINFWHLADIIVLPACIGMALGRIGNFINGELYGTVTRVPWCFKFPSADGCRHPSQLYESFYNILNFAILFFMSRKKHKEGFIFSAFLIFYGIFRFATEFVRYSEWRLFGIFSVGQLLCAAMVIAGAILMLQKK
jgi:phosphatidylglycerol:prolipoprotein diacylglycerol transferase